MSPRTTWLLLGATLATLALDLGVRGLLRAQDAPLPGLPPIDPAAVDWIELTHGDERLRLERTEAGWSVVSPYRHPADPIAVERLMFPLTRGLRADASLGRGELGTYGLDGAEPVKVELGSGTTSLVALYVGHDAPGGATFARFPDDDLVVRAPLGGRARFDRPARAWRDPRLWQFAPQQISTLRLTRPDQDLTLRRDDGRWTLTDDPSFPVDPALADAIAMALADLRATDVLAADHPAGLDAGASLTLTLTDDITHVARLGRTPDGAFAAIDGRDGVYRLEPRLVERLLTDREGWRDHTLWSVEPGSIRELVWREAEAELRAVRDPRTGTWVGASADPRALDAAARFLARARLERFVKISAAEAGFPSDRSVRVVADAVYTLELGGPGVLDGRSALYARDPARPDRIGQLEADLVRRLWPADR